MSELVSDIYGHKIGEIEAGVFTKWIDANKHILNLPEPSFAIDAFAYRRVKQFCHTIVIVERKTGESWKMDVGVFDKLKRGLNRGHGDQYRVAVRHFGHSPPVQPRLL